MAKPAEVDQKALQEAIEFQIVRHNWDKAGELYRRFRRISDSEIEDDLYWLTIAVHRAVYREEDFEHLPLECYQDLIVEMPWKQIEKEIGVSREQVEIKIRHAFESSDSETYEQVLASWINHFEKEDSMDEDGIKFIRERLASKSFKLVPLDKVNQLEPENIWQFLFGKFLKYFSSEEQRNFFIEQFFHFALGHIASDPRLLPRVDAWQRAFEISEERMKKFALKAYTWILNSGNVHYDKSEILGRGAQLIVRYYRLDPEYYDMAEP